MSALLVALAAAVGLPPLQAQAQPAYAAIPSVSISLPSNVLIGQSFNFTVTFANSGSGSGYGPFIDLVFPLTGADGHASTTLPLDGIDLVGADFLGRPVTSRVQTFPGPAGSVTCVNHPYAVNSSDSPPGLRAFRRQTGDTACNLRFLHPGSTTRHPHYHRLIEVQRLKPVLSPVRLTRIRPASGDID